MGPHRRRWTFRPAAGVVPAGTAGRPESSDTDLYDPEKEHHDLGAVLVAAVFEAISRVFDKKTRTLRKIAALAPGARDHLIELLTREARDLAGQFLNIIIRAIDYCPPMDITFGEFLRALVTADYVTVPEDPYGYREALVLAFRRYGITVPAVPDLSEEALLWKPPEMSDAGGRRLEFRRPAPCSRAGLVRRAGRTGEAGHGARRFHHRRSPSRVSALPNPASAMARNTTCPSSSRSEPFVVCHRTTNSTSTSSRR